MENLRRRTEREVAEARAYGIAVFARDMLAVADNLRRALDAIGSEGRASLTPTMTSFIEGVELTERELLKVLEKHGVKRFDPLGEKFDPNVHQAMFEVPDPSSPAGTVVRVVQAGFMIGERVLRPALVGVAKGGPRAAPPAAASANDNSASEEEPQGTI
jgi:molecular chaperone GrpE